MKFQLSTLLFFILFAVAMWSQWFALAAQDPSRPFLSHLNDHRTTSPKSMTSNEQQKWFPLESNPQLINEYIRKLGFDTSLYEFCDVFSTEDWALDMIPQPVAAVLLLYPPTETITNHEDNEAANEKIAPDAMQDQVWFIQQRIGNACGTIGLLHATMNAPEALRIFDQDSWLAQFAQECPIPLNPTTKAERLEADSRIAKLHDDATSSEFSSTRRPDRDERIEAHFSALVHVNGYLYELDGRKAGPIRHGPTTQATLLKDACNIIQKIMARDPSESRFAITALAPKQI